MIERFGIHTFCSKNETFFGRTTADIARVCRLELRDIPRLEEVDVYGLTA